MTGYLWIKAFHLITVITWFAGIFYLPRLFVYHASATDTVSIDRFKVMESKLYRIIMTPSAVIAVGLGLVLLVGLWQMHGASVWIWLKIALVAILVGFHLYCGWLIGQLANGAAPHSERFYRIFNEIPALLLILIVLLAVLKPF